MERAMTRWLAGPAGEKIRAAWTWWWGEIVPLLPAAWRGGAAFRRRAVMIELTEAGPLATCAGQPCRPGPDDEVTLILPAEAVLRRRLQLPAASARQLRRIVAFEQERLSPIEPGKLCADHVVIGRDRKARRVEVELRMVRRDRVEAAREACRIAGLTPHRILFAGDPVAADGAIFLPNAAPVPILRRRRSLQAAMIGIPLVLALSLPISETLRDSRDRAALEALVAGAKAESTAAETLRRQVDEAGRRAQFLARRREAPTVSWALAEATRLLPDGSWLFQFEMSDREVRLYGYSPAASSLIALFGESGSFTDARFRAPVTPGPRPGLERFEISMQLRGGPP